MSKQVTKYRVLAATLVIAAAGVVGTAHAEANERTGYAYDKQTGEFLYSETHREVMKDGRIIGNTVSYKDRAGNVFAEKFVDFRKSLTMPDFHLVNAENGHVEGVRGGREQLAVHFRRLSDADIREATVERPGNGIIDAGFDRFIEQNWDSLIAGEVIEREFLIPSQLDFFTFEVARVETSRFYEHAFELRIKSKLLQLFVEPVLVHYHARTRALLRYEGISNIRNEAGNNFEVRIEFADPDRIRVDGGVERPST